MQHEQQLAGFICLSRSMLAFSHFDGFGIVRRTEVKSNVSNVLHMEFNYSSSIEFCVFKKRCNNDLNVLNTLKW